MLNLAAVQREQLVFEPELLELARGCQLAPLQCLIKQLTKKLPGAMSVGIG